MLSKILRITLLSCCLLSIYGCESINDPSHKTKLFSAEGAIHNPIKISLFTPQRQVDGMWGKYQEEFSLSHYEDNPVVSAQILWWSKHSQYLYRVTERSAPYIYYILDELKKRNMP